jgi:hypothetical protein
MTASSAGTLVSLSRRAASKIYPQISQSKGIAAHRILRLLMAEQKFTRSTTACNGCHAQENKYTKTYTPNDFMILYDGVG